MASLRRTALFHVHTRAGAVFAHCHGWEIPEKFTTPGEEALRARSSAMLADISHRWKFDTVTPASSCSWRLSPRRYLTIARHPMTPPEGSVDVTSVYTNLLLAGPNSRRVLGLLTSLNVNKEALPNLSATGAKVAHIPAFLLREDIGALPAFQILIPREYSEDAWESILHAGAAWGICPAGLAALSVLEA